MSSLRINGFFGGAIHREDSAHVSGDFGILGLAVRLDTATALSNDADHIPLSTDSLGRLRVCPPESWFFYSDNFTAPNAAGAAVLGSPLLYSCVIRNTHATFEAELMASGGDWVELPASASVTYLQVRLSTIICKAQTDGENPVLDVSGSVV